MAIKNELLKQTGKTRNKILNDISKNENYKEMKVLRDMITEYLDLSCLLNPDIQNVGLKKEVAQPLLKALDVDRRILHVNLVGWTRDIEALLVNKREVMYQEIIDYANERKYFDNYKIKV